MRVWSFVWRVWIGGMLISLTVGAYNAGNLIAMVLSGMLGIYLIYRGLVYLIKGDPHQAAAAQPPAAAPSSQPASSQGTGDYAAERERNDAERLRRHEEWRRMHGQLTLKVAGVTFRNDDHTSRQRILREIAGDDDQLGTVSLEQYEYDGEPALHICYDDKCVGNVPAAYVAEVIALEPRITDLRLDVEDFETDDGKTIYRADLVITYLKPEI